MTDPKAAAASILARPSRVRYLVLALLCSLAFITSLDRVCISQVQDHIARDLQFEHLNADDFQRLEAASVANYASILTADDETALVQEGLSSDTEARRQAA